MNFFKLTIVCGIVFIISSSLVFFLSLTHPWKTYGIENVAVTAMILTVIFAWTSYYRGDCLK